MKVAKQLVSLAVTSLLAVSQDGSSPVCLEVCMSPGCLADGALSTFQRLQALAPPDKICVREGGCVSACGKGPVVKENDKIIHKYITNDKLLESLLDQDALPSELVQGYDQVLSANEAAIEENHELASTLYKEGIDRAMKIAIARLQPEATFSNSEDNNYNSILWLVRAHGGWAKSLLELQQYDKALESCRTACDLSNQQDPDSLELLALISNVCKNDAGELKALQAFLSLPVTSESLPVAIANKRRSLGFRLAKLEREVK